MSLTVRILGALALLGVAADHLYEYFVDHYSAVPTIGTLFLLDSVAAITLGLALLVPLRRMLPAPIAERVRALAAAAGILLAAASLAGLFASEVMPLFGFMEFGYRLVVVLAIVAESAAIVALGMFLVVVEPSPTRDSGCVTMVRSRSRSSERKGNMKRSLIVIAGAGIVAAGVAGVTGALSSGAGRAGAAPAAVVAQTSMPMPMPMPATTASAPGPVHMELHQRVVRVKIMNFAFMPARIEPDLRPCGHQGRDLRLPLSDPSVHARHRDRRRDGSMTRYIEHQPDTDDDVDRRGFLKCMAWAGTGVAFTLAGCGVATTRLGTEAADKATGSFTFVQISDSHIGFDKAANQDVIGTLERCIARINAMSQRPAFVVHTGDHVHLSTLEEFDTVKQLLG
ncbi:MAG: hypothetical protein ABSH51_29705, partial [Solirubrobacteraceae bacterium]